MYRNFQTQAELDAQYNTKELGLDTNFYLQDYIKNSIQAREQLACKLDIPYGLTTVENLDIFPANNLQAPILIFIHGGDWVMGSSKDFSFVAKSAVAAGITVIVVNYGLCPKVKIDEIVRQNRAAVAWVYRNAESFGGNRERIYVSGHSAGGHLAAMVMATDWNDYNLPENVVKAGCVISGLFDLVPFPYTWLQTKIQLSCDEILRNSPIYHIPDKSGSLIVTYGSEESSEFRRQSQDFLSAWKSKGLQGEYLPQPGTHHFTAINGFLDVNSPLCKAIFRQMNII